VCLLIVVVAYIANLEGIEMPFLCVSSRFPLPIVINQNLIGLHRQRSLQRTGFERDGRMGLFEHTHIRRKSPQLRNTVGLAGRIKVFPVVGHDGTHVLGFDEGKDSSSNRIVVLVVAGLFAVLTNKI
jgi:hypothetical protein